MIQQWQTQLVPQLVPGVVELTMCAQAMKKEKQPSVQTPTEKSHLVQPAHHHPSDA